jgi:hypothetical protein
VLLARRWTRPPPEERVVHKYEASEEKHELPILTPYVAARVAAGAVELKDECPIHLDTLHSTTEIGVMPCGHCFTGDVLRIALTHRPDCCAVCKQPGLPVYVPPLGKPDSALQGPQQCWMGCHDD